MVNLCKNSLREKYKGTYYEDVIDYIVDELEYHKKNSKSKSEFKKRSEAFQKEVKRKMAHRIKERAENAHKFNKLEKFVLKDEFKENPADSLKAVTNGVDYLVEGGNMSIEMEAHGISSKYKRELADALKDRDLLDIAKSGKLDQEIYIARHAMAKGEPVNVSPQAKEIAEVYANILNGTQTEMELVGSGRNRLEGYLGKRIHDGLTMEKVDFEDWFKDTYILLDLDRIYGAKAGDIAHIKENLKGIYDSIILGEYNPGLPDQVMKMTDLKSQGGFDKKLSRSRYLFFKDGASEYAYMKKYGKRTILESVLKAIDNDARNAATINRLGTNPRGAWEKLKARKAKSLKGDPEAFKKFKSKVANLDELFQNTTRGFNVGDSMLSRWSRNLRSMASWRSLGKTVFVAGPTDLATQASVLKAKTGKGYFSAYKETISSYFDALPKGKRKQYAKRLQMFTDNALGEYWSRFNPDDIAGGTVSKINDLYYKLNLMHPQTDIFKTGNQMVYAMHLADNAGRSFDGLHPNDKANLARYDINAADWDNLSKAVETVEGQRMITPYAIEQLDLDPKTKRELRVKLAAYLQHNGEFLGSPSPGIAERTAFIGNTDPDSYPGQMLRMVQQFKNFGLTMHKVARHAMMSDPENAVRSMKDAIRNKSSMRNLAGMFMGTTSLAAIGMILSDLSMGKSVRDVDSTDFWVEAMTKGGSLGLYGDFLWADYDSRYRNLSEDILGPVIGGTFGNLSELWSALRKGDPKAGKVFSMLRRETPFVNLFYTQAVLDYMILDEIQEALSPGYTKRKRERMDERGQEYLLWE